MAANETYEQFVDMVGWYSNCAIEAVKAWTSGAKIKVTRNRFHRLHLYWEIDNKRFEFYARDRAQRSYISNLLYKGFIKEIQ